MSSDIIKVAEGVEFRLEDDSEVGAREARVTATELARHLGFARVAKLEELARRDSKFINDFSDVPTVGMSRAA